MSTNMPNLKQIGGGHCKKLVDLTWKSDLGRFQFESLEIRVSAQPVVRSGGDKNTRRRFNCVHFIACFSALYVF